MALVFLYPLLFLTLQLLPISTAEHAYKSISLGSSLTASKHISCPSWKSPSGEFAFGFKSIGQDGFLLAIWFDKITEKTIVWSKRDILMQEGSKVKLTEEGQLILKDQNGNLKWSTETELSRTGVANHAMLDTGNFVLASNDSTNLWESFHYPTDTILPTQTMFQGSKLVASISDSNYSSGRFMFKLQTDGNLVMCTTEYPSETPNSVYWSTQTSIGSGYKVYFNQSGYLYLKAKNGNIHEIISNVVPANFYQRMILDYDGVFRHYSYPKKSASSGGQWSTLYNIPTNICMAIKESIGSGACGFNSFCSLGDDQKKKCHCPPGYTFFDPDDQMKGCKQTFAPHSCDKASEEMALFEFKEIVHTDWPLNDYEHFGGVSQDYCKQACLSDCFCYVFVYNNGKCWKKGLPFSNGRNDPSVEGTIMIKIRIANSDSNKGQRILSTLLGCSIFLDLLLLLAAFIFSYHLIRINEKKSSHRKPCLP